MPALRKRAPLAALAMAAALAPAAIAEPGGCKFSTHLQGSNEVPPRPTQATGQWMGTTDATQTSLDYKLIVSNIDNVTAAHLHLGAPGSNGPVVAFQAGPFPPGGGPSNGPLAQGTITGADLVGPLGGQPLTALVDAMKAGAIYVNVHTDDGVPPPNTGPGDFPGGEVRGQVRPIGHDCETRSSLQYWFTCGDPVCVGHEDRGIPPCTTQQEGEPCTQEGELCDPIDPCNRLIVCAEDDPTAGGCPISRRAAKTDVRYLDATDVARLHDELVSTPLATFRYAAPDAPKQQHLGFMIDDLGPSLAIDPERNMVDLYGYTSMAVAALQSQAARIRALEAEMEALRCQVEAGTP